MGYCGFIGWITGYPEVKTEIKQNLEKMYQGDEFEVTSVSYSDNLKGYNFKATDITRDITNKGSYFPQTNTIWANGFMWSVVLGQWRDIFEPYIKKISNNYLIIGGIMSPEKATDFRKIFIPRC
ncbi:hypothetical protein fh0823_12630 [Francisella halioticida]|uniref:Uncharacterized protein n=1 Tax=Francisella halioticida TaxID=549298 RepID=A0ABN5AXR6_9GAMM|nr:hypothetical protein [Francisella halioticida]ASG68289.1 hypothetical protein CDV26_07670 [Francisella halioticida]BCD91124.1 hypothetical protein fh0823_12630 [Francisella halioticida]